MLLRLLLPTNAHRRLGPPLLRALIAWSPRSWRPPVKVWGAVIKVRPGRSGDAGQGCHACAQLRAHTATAGAIAAHAPMLMRSLVCAQVSPSGKILSLLLDPTGARVATASAATEHKGRLFLGSIMGGA